MAARRDAHSVIESFRRKKSFPGVLVSRMCNEAACMLHNFCQRQGEKLSYEMIREDQFINEPNEWNGDIAVAHNEDEEEIIFRGSIDDLEVEMLPTLDEPQKFQTTLSSSATIDWCSCKKVGRFRFQSTTAG
ncbi:hypothetical protein RN001_005829 [Aquatica leii]|uniref:Uncharacterized protein n=1 Tax=Aquatica leii TaxID=1421715 RepID=A0AAN7SS50_9COLE|nr:hypothetical protein RN001_005829 [Aquatica leii]